MLKGFGRKVVVVLENEVSSFRGESFQRFKKN